MARCGTVKGKTLFGGGIPTPLPRDVTEPVAQGYVQDLIKAPNWTLQQIRELG
jgi:hypothetical protein